MASAATAADALRDGHVVKEIRVPQGKTGRYGHSEVLIRAPLESVRKHVMNFGQYHKMSPDKFRKSRVVKRHPKGDTDVYLQFGMADGIISFYTLARFAPVRTEGRTEVIEGKQIEGDVRDANIVWRLEPVSDHETLLTCDTILVPDFYAPESMIEEELRDSAAKAVSLMRGRAEADYAAQQKKTVGAAVVKPN
jgi:hypothetical protein